MAHNTLFRGYQKDLVNKTHSWGYQTKRMLNKQEAVQREATKDQ